VDGEIMRSYYVRIQRGQVQGAAEERRQQFQARAGRDHLALRRGLRQGNPAPGATDRGTPKVVVEGPDNASGHRHGDTHFVKVPENHIVIDFDLKDDNGDKALDRNLEAAASGLLPTQRSASPVMGVHLHYDYTGDASQLSSESLRLTSSRRFWMTPSSPGYRMTSQTCVRRSWRSPETRPTTRWNA
jgi:hypothetical protein